MSAVDVIGHGVVRVLLDNKGYLSQLEATRSITADRVGKIGRAWTKGVTLPVAALGAVSIKMAADFQTAMTRVHTQAGGSAKDVRVLGNEVLKLASHSQNGPTELAKALYHLKSVGLDNNKAMQALVQTQKLANVGGSDLEATTNAVAGAWRSGIRGAQNFGQEVATLNAIVGAGNMSMQGLTAAMSTGFLTSARAFGLSLHSVGAALALLTDEGQPAEVAATRLRMSFSLLGAPSKKANAVLQSIGLSGIQLAETMRKPNGLIKTIQLLHDHLGQAGDKAHQATLLSQAFGGGRSSAAIINMIQNLGALKQKYAQIGHTTANFNNDVVAQSKTVAASWARTKAALETAAVRIGMVLIPMAEGAAKWIGRMAAGFDKLNPGTQKFIVRLALVAAAVGPVLIIGAKLYKSFLVLKEAWTALSLVFATSPLGLVLTAIGLLSIGLIEAYKHSKVFRAIVQGAFHGVEVAARAVGSFLAGPFTRFFTKTIPHAFGTVVNFIKTHWDLLPAIIGGPVGIIVTLVLTHWNTIKRVTKTVFETIRKALATVFGAIHQLFSRWWNAYTTVVSNAVHATWRVVRAVFTNIKNTTSTIFNAIGRFLGAYWRTELSVAKKGVSLIFNGVKAGFNAVHNTTVRIVNTIADFMKNVFTKTIPNAVRTGVGLLGKFWNGIKKMFSGPVDWVIGNVINRLIGAVDTVAGALGHPNLIHKLNAHAAGTSQVLPGYTPGRDPHTFYSATAGTLKLSGGEGIARPEVVRVMGSRFDGLNAAARAGGTTGVSRYMTQSFRGGGRVQLPSTPGKLTWPTTGHIISTYPGHDGVDINGPGQDYGNPIFAFRNGTITYTGYGHGYGDAIFEKVAGNGPTVVYGHGSKVFVHAGEHVVSGETIGQVGATGNATGPHLHFGIPGGTFAQAMALLRGALTVGGKNGGTSFLGGLGNFFKAINPLPLLLKALGGLGHLVLGHVPGGKFGSAIASGAFSKLKGFALSMLQNLAATFNAANSSSGSVAGGPSISGGSKGKLEQYAFSLFKNFGWGSNQQSDLIRLWDQESGWNPHARNPSSGAYGIPQALPASKIPGGYGSTPGAQIRWGLGYIRGRYGSPAGAWAHEVAHNWYDGGGLAIGAGMFPKKTPLPERVLSPRQTVAFERWLTHAPHVRSSGGTQGSKGKRVELVITNWETGEGYFRQVADEQIGADHSYTAGRGRMGTHT